MSCKNKGNPVSNKSKLRMENTLLYLMQTENYKEITIQEITDNAGLSRRTFYRNYSSKDEILEGYFYKIWLEYRALLFEQTDLSLPNIARMFFTVMINHFDFLSLLHRHQLLPSFLAKIDVLLPPEFDKLKGKNVPFSKESTLYALTFSAGGFMRILIRWMNDSVQKSPEEMAHIVEDYILICNYPN